MAVNRRLREDLLKKLGIGVRRLNQMAAALAAELPSTHEQAINTLAYQNGLRLSKYLSEEETAEVRGLISQSRGRTLAAPVTPVKNGTRPSGPREVLVTIAGMKVERVPGMTATHANEAKAMAEKVYPALYVFENSARDLITKVLKNGVGDNWWDNVVPHKIKEKAARRKRDEAKDPWHGKRGAALIDYLDLTDLPSIVSAPQAWPHFKAILSRAAWFQELVNELNVSRRVAAHMNPLAADDVKNVEAAFRKWAKVLNAKADLIP